MSIATCNAVAATRRLLLLVLLPALLFTPATLFGFAFTKSPPVPWAPGPVPMDLLFSGPDQPLIDGTATWRGVAEAALNIWNEHLSNVRFTTYATQQGAPTENDRINQVFLDTSVYGEAFGAGVLAITWRWDDGVNTIEADTVFNANLPWNSYRGPLQQTGGGQTLNDLRRVAIHEFGHTLGLDHPDEAGQNVDAIMNSHESDRELPSSDDIAGINQLYSGPQVSTNFTKGTYTGLFSGSDGPTPASAGSCTLTTTLKNRGFSMKVQIGAARYSGKGQFDLNGAASTTLKGKAGALLNATLQLDPTDFDLVSGTVSNSTWSANLAATRAGFARRTNPSPIQGAFTMICLNTNTPTGSTPDGASFGALKVNALGKIRFSGTLADGTKITLGAQASKLGQWPLYASLYKGGGALFGWLTLATDVSGDISGDIFWSKPPGNSNKPYSAGFTNLSSTAGSHYAKPRAGQKALSLDVAQLVLVGGIIPDGIQENVSVDARNKIAGTGSDQVKGSISTANGFVTGKVITSAFPKGITFQGAILQNRNGALGFFLQNNQSGAVAILPP